MAGRSVELVLLSYYDDWGKCRRATHLLYNRSRLKLLSFPSYGQGHAAFVVVGMWLC